MEIVKEIGKYKKENNITIFQATRWDEIVKKNLDRAHKKGLSEKFITKIFESIHQESIAKQTAIMNGEEI